MWKNTENVIEFETNSKMATVSFTSRRHIGRIKKLYETRQSEFGYLIENADGSICAKIPEKWVKINPGAAPDAPKRELSPEHKEKLLAGRVAKSSLEC